MKNLKKRSLALPEFMRSRWFIIATLAVVILGAVGAYVWWSKNSWDAYEKQYTGLHRDVDAKLTAVFSLQSDTVQQRQEKTTHLAKMSADIEEMSGSFCRQNSLIGWQTVFNQYKTHEESCKASLAALGAFNDQLKLTVGYLQQEQALAKLLAAAPAQAEVAESEFKAQLTAWRTVYDGTRNAGSSGDFDTVKQGTVDATGEIVKTWEEIIAAHQTKDKTRYMKAVQALAAAYDKLGIVTSVNTAQLSGVSTKLQEAYQRLR